MFNQEKEMIKLQEEMNECAKGLSKCDKSISNVLHDVETRNFNAYEGFVLCKELKLLRENRRCWKERKCELREAYLGLGGDTKLNELKKNRERRKKKYLKRDPWKKNFSDEAMAILQGK
ncbi:hypothetical protein [Staphylococcus gallinarum]|uniref:hypothetical protein n=1 Tax=Staphylococcus gallinarum TaxID=1293 RepID=UPI0030C5314D